MTYQENALASFYIIPKLGFHSEDSNFHSSRNEKQNKTKRCFLAFNQLVLSCPINDIACKTLVGCELLWALSFPVHLQH